MIFAFKVGRRYELTCYPGKSVEGRPFSYIELVVEGLSKKSIGEDISRDLNASLSPFPPMSLSSTVTCRSTWLVQGLGPVVPGDEGAGTGSREIG